MDAHQSQALRELLQRQEIAALGTLHKGEPFVSMVPYALLADGALVVHVSRLATHTRDMEEHAGVSVMVLGERSPDAPAQAVPRATLQGAAHPLGTDASGYAEARAAYLARFPASEPMFGFGDFSLFRIVPRSARFVGGFAQAGSLTGAQYAQLMSSAATPP
ncbi:pyridoxamine 5'-phosphate oxidase family protein [Ramlibacter sp. USB13]|uniref:Pyridoxamine 5'-phosphate oxidase family protein n=1 Tax=Ramlibacter cellulosilyticus TaxID=2764187 RepID=A0A923MUV1_9BURK|nr:pyridoxamine 5'-phosphate oxidase family protein [Ramlibacter cellulosilyticus]MBC5785069.1 pyridoxamine 5'-phosphate oxidase family protein [Ramlibacter cellulosilyticus]